MAWQVTTNTEPVGYLHTLDGSGSINWEDEAQAKARAEKANAAAEELGIKTRYEVTEA